MLKLRKILKELESIRGRHTELVSVYIPSGHNTIETINQVMQEKSTASNIKSKATRKNVLDALEKIVQHLRLFKQTPQNGLVVFCGNVSPVEGKADLRLWSFEPPDKMNVKLYWCDQVFVMDPLKDLVKEREVYGLIVLDANEANIGLLKGKQVVQLKHMDSTVPAKSVKGGMCLRKDTIINNGKTYEIRKTKPGDKILSFDFKAKRLVFSKVEGVKKRKAEAAYKITTDAGHEIVATPEHLFFVKRLLSVAEVPAEKIKGGDRLLSIGFCEGDGIKTVRVESKDVVRPDGYFFDLSVPGTENFIANGLVVHNSQMRYDRIRDDALNEFFRKVAEVASLALLEQPDLKGVLVGGPGPTKDTFFRNEYLNYQIQKKVLGVKDIGYTGEEGLIELVKRSDDLIKESKYAKERELLQKFFVGLQKNGNVSYGYGNVKKALDLGAVETMLISEDFSMYKAKFRCQCGYAKQMDITPDKKRQLCDNCHSPMTLEKEEDIAETLLEDAERFGTKVAWVSTDTEEGRQFKSLGGIGALLRYRIG